MFSTYRVSIKKQSDHKVKTNRRRAYKKFKHVRKYGPLSTQSSRYESTYILDYYKKFFKLNKNRAKTTSFKLPNKFCFITDPENCLQSIAYIINSSRNIGNKTIHISHEAVKSYDLTAEVLLANGVKSALEFRKSKNKEFEVRGTLSKNLDHQQLVNEIGIIRSLDAETDLKLPHPREVQYLYSFRSIYRVKASPHSVDDKSTSAYELAQHLRLCLETKNLTIKDCNALSKCVGEVLDNAERHSSKYRSNHVWHVNAFFNDNTEHRYVEISIFNFGRSIAESFKDLAPHSYPYQLIKVYLDNHGHVVPRDDLITVAALQHRMSSKLTDENSNMGQGTLILLEYFESLLTEYNFLKNRNSSSNVDYSPIMSIVSGSTHILIDGTYQLGRLKGTEDEQYVVAFNTENDLKSPPCKKAVRHMDNAFFPGVAISIRFPL